jgi:hypothetical protein
MGDGGEDRSSAGAIGALTAGVGAETAGGPLRVGRRAAGSAGGRDLGSGVSAHGRASVRKAQAGGDLGRYASGGDDHQRWPENSHAAATIASSKNVGLRRANCQQAARTNAARIWSCLISRPPRKQGAPPGLRAVRALARSPQALSRRGKTRSLRRSQSRLARSLLFNHVKRYATL